MSGAGITQGCTAPPDVLYCPGDPVTRAQMATFLVRALNLPAAAVSPFLESMNPQGHLPSLTDSEARPDTIEDCLLRRHRRRP